MNHRVTLPLIAVAIAVAAIPLPSPAAEAQSTEPFPATYADPPVPLLQLPTNFRARRTTVNVRVAGTPVEIFNATGAGCVRHLWFVLREQNIDDLSIEITVDGAAEPHQQRRTGELPGLHGHQ